MGRYTLGSQHRADAAPVCDRQAAVGRLADYRQIAMQIVRQPAGSEARRLFIHDRRKHDVPGSCAPDAAIASTAAIMAAKGPFASITPRP